MWLLSTELRPSCVVFVDFMTRFSLFVQFIHVRWYSSLKSFRNGLRFIDKARPGYTASSCCHRLGALRILCPRPKLSGSSFVAGLQRPLLSSSVVTRTGSLTIKRAGRDLDSAVTRTAVGEGEAGGVVDLGTKWTCFLGVFGGATFTVVREGEEGGVMN